MAKLILFLILIGAGFHFLGGGGSEINQRATLSAPVANKGDVNNDPIQKPPAVVKMIPFGIGHLTFLAEYQVTARVISRENYTLGKNAKISPVDFALGWGRMADPTVYNSLHITQSNRFYHYQWVRTPPIPESEIIAHSANTHLIASNPDVASMIDRIKDGDIVTLKGYLVKYREDANDSWWEWTSSMSRTDTGDGACELLYVEYVVRQ